MTPAVLDSLRQRFAVYAGRFRSPDAEADRAIRLKIDHTHRVVAAIGWLAQRLDLRPEEVALAEAMALLHDVGRFRQYQRYGTYLDAQTENHALLGVRVIREEQLLDGVDGDERRLIEDAVAVHNAARLPHDPDAEKLMFMRLLRDADKLDIWKVVLDHYYERAEEPSIAVGLGLPDRPECSAGVLEAVQRGELVRFTDIRTLTDFKLMQLSWVFDLSFAPTFEWVRREQYVEQMAGVLPDTNTVRDLVIAAQEHVASRAPDRGVAGGVRACGSRLR
jgi:hypothetical protein